MTDWLACKGYDRVESSIQSTYIEAAVKTAARQTVFLKNASLINKNLNALWKC